MVDVTLSRGSTSVTISLLGNGGNLAVARDVGKPNASQHSVGREDPIHRDHRSASDAFTLGGVLTGTNAYSDAQTLAEDLIKTRATTGTPLQLDLSNLPSRGTYDVAPSAKRALELEYVPGRTNFVTVQMTLNVVSKTVGGSQNTRGTISPDAGNGIKLDRSGTSVTFAARESVTRFVGRPGGKLQDIPGTTPQWIDWNEPASDVFEIETTFPGSNAESDSNTLEETIVRDRLGDSTLTLHFLSNLYGLDAYDVAPTGTQAVRTSFQTGETGVVAVPKLSLRVVDNTT